jgi:hypothetical protein
MLNRGIKFETRDKQMDGEFRPTLYRRFKALKTAASRLLINLFGNVPRLLSLVGAMSMDLHDQGPAPLYRGRCEDGAIDWIDSPFTSRK